MLAKRSKEVSIRNAKFKYRWVGQNSSVKRAEVLLQWSRFTKLLEYYRLQERFGKGGLYNG
jgi:hypothetical protein